MSLGLDLGLAISLAIVQSCIGEGVQTVARNLLLLAGHCAHGWGESGMAIDSIIGPGLLGIVPKSLDTCLGIDRRAKLNGMCNQVVNASLGEIASAVLACVCIAVGVVCQLATAVEVLYNNSYTER